MKTKALAVFLTLVMIVGLMPAVVFAEDPVEGVECIGECTNEAHVAAIGNVHYNSIQKAVDKAQDNDVVTIIRNCIIDCKNVGTLDGKYNTMVCVAGKTVTVN